MDGGSNRSKYPSRGGTGNRSVPDSMEAIGRLAAKGVQQGATTLYERANMKLSVRQQRQGDNQLVFNKSSADLRPDEKTVGMVTQNVNGLGSDDKSVQRWFRSFGEVDTNGRADVTILQEAYVQQGEIS
ncbi:unnamed protein product [Phytophthora fragariaefolia]|uniref:Unnamed protein product n=1 Tax=Phytophthora fragariaefolia TaxID=1490495 RepID=A0A9W7D8R3_9STRA|nr:unnamed protein product [Phytophthora fragariaefolia]